MSEEFSNNPFKALKKDKAKFRDADESPKAPKKAAPKPPPTDFVHEPDGLDDEDALFLQAMGRADRRSRGKAPVRPKMPSDNKPFAQLLEEDEAARAKGSEPEAPKPVKKAQPAPAPLPDPVVPPEEDDAFLQAMGDVEPMDGKGRDIPAKAEPTPAPKITNPDEAVRRHLQDLVQGKVEFQVEFSGEYQHGHVLGLDPKIFNKLKAGSYSMEAHLDLHGLNADQAQVEVLDFVRRHYELGRRHLLLVTGRGKNSPDGRGVLRDEVQNWLTHEPLRRVVLAFVTAQPRHGGPGALYVLLRQFKKSRGKIIWDKLALD